MNFYETLRFELKDEVGITVATHGWIGAEMRRGKFVMEEGAEMQWKEEREVRSSSISCFLNFFYDQRNIRILYYCLIIPTFSRPTYEVARWRSLQSTLYPEPVEEIRTWSVRAGTTYSSFTESLRPKSCTGPSASSWPMVGPPGRPPSSVQDVPFWSLPHPRGSEVLCSRLPLLEDSLEAPRGPPRYLVGDYRSPTEWVGSQCNFMCVC